MMVSMKQKNLLGITAPGEEQVKFHAATSSRNSKNMMEEENDEREVGEYKNTVLQTRMQK